MNKVKSLTIALLAILVTACATVEQQPVDNSAFRKSDPKSILVLPPINETVDVNATASVFAQTVEPLAESGYYVFPVAVVDETFKQNGLLHAEEIQVVPLNKLTEIFAADAVLYMNITDYGTKYIVVDSNTSVAINARLVDANSGEQLWQGSAYASSAENSNSSFGLAGMLIEAVVKQVFSSVNDAAFKYADIANWRLLFAGGNSGMLYGPRSPQHQPVTPSLAP